MNERPRNSLSIAAHDLFVGVVNNFREITFRDSSVVKELLTQNQGQTRRLVKGLDGRPPDHAMAPNNNRVEDHGMDEGFIIKYRLQWIYGNGGKLDRNNNGQV